MLRRAHIVRQRTRLKNQVHAILARNLVPRCPAAGLFGIKGRAWLAAQDLPADEHAAVIALLRQLDFHAQELALIDAHLARAALEQKDVRRLMTIPRAGATASFPPFYYPNSPDFGGGRAQVPPGGAFPGRLADKTPRADPGQHSSRGDESCKAAHW